MVWLYSVRVQVIIILCLAYAIFSFHQILYSVESKLHKMSTVCMFLTGWQPTTTLTTLLIYCETGSPMYRNSTIMWSGGQRKNQGLPCFFTCGFMKLVHFCVSCTTFLFLIQKILWWGRTKGLDEWALCLCHETAAGSTWVCTRDVGRLSHGEFTTHCPLSSLGHESPTW